MLQPPENADRMPPNPRQQNELPETSEQHLQPGTCRKAQAGELPYREEPQNVITSVASMPAETEQGRRDREPPGRRRRFLQAWERTAKNAVGRACIACRCVASRLPPVPPMHKIHQNRDKWNAGVT
jgi:hypothetical protein